jgi:hypothetical protein
MDWPGIVSALIHIPRMAESALRSLNNLLEKFHHSFWFYVMADADRYITIAIYIAPAILLIAPLIVKVSHEKTIHLKGSFFMGRDWMEPSLSRTVLFTARHSGAFFFNQAKRRAHYLFNETIFLSFLNLFILRSWIWSFFYFLVSCKWFLMTQWVECDMVFDCLLGDCPHIVFLGILVFH